MWDPVKEAKKQANNAVKKIINPAVDAAKGVVQKIGRDVEKTANQAKREVEGGLNQVKNEVKGAVTTIEREGNKAVNVVGRELDKIPDHVEKAVRDAVNAMAALATGEGLKVIRKAVKGMQSGLNSEIGLEFAPELDKIGIDLQLGPVSLSYADFYSRADGLVTVLDRLINEPPTFRRGPLIGLVEALGPDSIDLGVDFEFALVVGSDSLGVGVKMSTIPLGLFTRIGDRVLKEIGVPE